MEGRRVRGPRRTVLPRGSQCQVLRWWDLLPGCLANHSDSGSSLGVCALLSQDGFQQGGFWEVGRIGIGVSSLLLTLPEFFSLVVACEFCIPYQTSCVK